MLMDSGLSVGPVLSFPSAHGFSGANTATGASGARKAGAGLLRVREQTN